MLSSDALYFLSKSSFKIYKLNLIKVKIKTEIKVSKKNQEIKNGIIPMYFPHLQTS